MEISAVGRWKEIKNNTHIPYNEDTDVIHLRIKKPPSKLKIIFAHNKQRVVLHFSSLKCSLNGITSVKYGSSVRQDDIPFSIFSIRKTVDFVKIRINDTCLVNHVFNKSGENYTDYWSRRSSSFKFLKASEKHGGEYMATTGFMLICNG